MRVGRPRWRHGPLWRAVRPADDRRAVARHGGGRERGGTVQGPTEVQHDPAGQRDQDLERDDHQDRRERGDDAPPHRQGVVAEGEGVANVEAQRAKPADQHRGVGPALGDVVGVGDGAHDPAEHRGELGDDERGVQQDRERAGDAGVVQAELVDQPQDGVVGGRAGDRGDAEDAGADRDDDQPAHWGQVAELGHAVLLVGGAEERGGPGWRGTSRQRRRGGRWL